MLLLSLACATPPGLLPSLEPEPAWAALPAEASLKAGLSLDEGEVAGLEVGLEAAGWSVPALEERLFARTGLVAGAGAIRAAGAACLAAGCAVEAAGEWEGLDPARVARAGKVGLRAGAAGWEIEGGRGARGLLELGAGRLWLGSPGMRAGWGAAAEPGAAEPGWRMDVPAGDIWAVAADQERMRGQIRAFVEAAGIEGGAELLDGWESRYAARPALVRAVEALAWSVDVPEAGGLARVAARARMASEADAAAAQRWLWLRLAAAQVRYAGTAEGAILGTAEFHREGAVVEVELRDVATAGGSALVEILARTAPADGGQADDLVGGQAGGAR